jgi:4-hydroxybenzoate polyprenyltransferase
MKDEGQALQENERMPKKRAIPADYLFLVRPTLLIPSWTFLILGYFWSMRVQKMAWRPWAISGDLAMAFLMYTALMGGIYIVNQIVDRESDRINRKLFLLSEGYISVPAAVTEAIILFALAIGLSVIARPLWSLVVVLSLALGLMYSVPPFTFKGRPFLDLLSNAFGYGLLNFWMGWLAGGAVSTTMVAHSVPYILSVGAVFASTTVPDIEGDRSSDNRTTGVVWGARRTLWLALALLLGAIGSAILIRDYVVLPVAMLALPVFGWAAITGELWPCLLSYRIGGGLLVVVAALLFPPFLVLLLVSFFSMRIYYRYRFNMTYPSLLAHR